MNATNAASLVEWDEFDGTLTFKRHDTIRAAVVIDDDFTDPTAAMRAARMQREDWIKYAEDREFVKGELKAMFLSLDEIDAAQAFGWQDRLAEALRTLADQIAQVACDLNVNAAGDAPTCTVTAANDGTFLAAHAQAPERDQFYTPERFVEQLAAYAGDAYRAVATGPDVAVYSTTASHDGQRGGLIARVTLADDASRRMVAGPIGERWPVMLAPIRAAAGLDLIDALDATRTITATADGEPSNAADGERDEAANAATFTAFADGSREWRRAGDLGPCSTATPKPQPGDTVSVRATFDRPYGEGDSWAWVTLNADTLDAVTACVHVSDLAVIIPADGTTHTATAPNDGQPSNAFTQLQDEPREWPECPECGGQTDCWGGGIWSCRECLAQIEFEDGAFATVFPFSAERYETETVAWASDLGDLPSNAAVTIMYRNSWDGGDGWTYYPVTVEIPAACPVCGGPRGEPTLRRFCEEGDWYDLSTWENPCGHIDRYRDVYAEASHTLTTASTDQPSNATTADVHCAVLERRLQDGRRRIDEARAQGIDIREWEAFWLRLLAEYEAVCRGFNGGTLTLPGYEGMTFNAATDDADITQEDLRDLLDAKHAAEVEKTRHEEGEEHFMSLCPLCTPTGWYEAILRELDRRSRDDGDDLLVNAATAVDCISTPADGEDDTDPTVEWEHTEETINALAALREIQDVLYLVGVKHDRGAALAEIGGIVAGMIGRPSSLHVATIRAPHWATAPNHEEAL